MSLTKFRQKLKKSDPLSSDESDQEGEGVVTRRQALKRKPPDLNSEDEASRSKVKKLVRNPFYKQPSPTHSDIDEANSPVAGPSRILNPKRQALRQQRSPSPESDNLSGNETASSETEAESNIISIIQKPNDKHMFDQRTPIYEDSNIEIYALKEAFKRQKIFPISDHLYTVKIRVKSGRPPLLSSLLNALEKTLVHIIHAMQRFYKDEPQTLLYMTIYQKTMASAITSPAIDLARSNPQDMVNHSMSMLNNFLNSADGLRLDDSFIIYFKTVSTPHVNYSRHRRGPVLIVGCDSTVNYNGLLNVNSDLDPFLKDKCLLTSIILGMSLFERCAENFKILLNLCCSDTKTKIKNIGLKRDTFLKNLQPYKSKSAFDLMKSRISELIESCQLPSEGPYSASEVLPSITQHLNIQVHIINSLLCKQASIYSWPPVFDSSLRQVILFKISQHHVSFVYSLSSLFHALKRKVCFYCRKSFYYNFYHFCDAEKFCFPCKRPFSKPTDVPQIYDYFVYCDSNSESFILDTPKECEKCNLASTTLDCFNYHKKCCGVKESSQGRGGYYCPDCCNFFSKKQYLTPELAKLNHVCNKNYQMCYSCKKAKEPNHQCSVTKATASKVWPNLAYMAFGYKSNGSCVACFHIKDDFRKAKNISWKMLYLHENYSNLVCAKHKDLWETFYEPNLVVIYREKDRGIFEPKVIGEEDLKLDCSLKDSTGLKVDYVPDKVDAPDFFQFDDFKQGCQSILQLRKALQEQPRKSLLEKIMLEITGCEYQNTTFLCLNASEGSHSFLMRGFVKMDMRPFVLQRGNKISFISIDSLNMRFLDASNYFSGTVEDIAKDFAPQEVMHYFAERLNVEENYSYEGDWPEFEDFVKFADSKELVDEKRLFYENKSGKWSFRNQLLEAVNSEAKILAVAGCNFLKLCFEFQVKLKSLPPYDSKKGWIHPFEKKITSISGFTFNVCSFYFLNELNLHGVNNPNGGKGTNSSRSEMEFCYYKSFFEPEKQWQHLYNSPLGQKAFGKNKVDLYSPVDKEITEFYGCVTHFHLPPDCTYKQNRDKTKESVSPFGIPLSNLKIQDNSRKLRLLTNYSEEVKDFHVQYECDWREKKKENDYQMFKQIYAETLKFRPVSRLCPRTTVRGGLTEIYCLRWQKEYHPDENFFYSDVQGLYSFAAIGRPLPKGKYEIFIDIPKGDIDFDGSFHLHKGNALVCGAAQVTVRPPNNLAKPFLQYRVLDNFNFLALCRLCVLSKKKKCLHRQSRYFTSTWLFSDLRKAAKLGYEITHWHEIYYFPEHSDYLSFYSKLWYAEKIQSSGYPSSVISHQDKLTYCQDVNSSLNLPECFNLNPDSIKKNDAKRQLAKSCLNNLYGKFSQQTPSVKSEYVLSPHRLQEILAQYPVLNLTNLSESMLLVEYETNLATQVSRSNLFVGAQINAYGREIIYEHMEAIERCGGKVFSVDVDGLFYSLPKNVQSPLKFSNNCGDFKNMLQEGEEIISFFALGVKNYCIVYKTAEGQIKSMIKLKGASLTSHCNADVITPEVYENFIKSHFEKTLNKILIPQSKFCIDPETKNYYKKFQTYTFANELYLKRFIPEGNNNLEPGSIIETLPFGFKKKRKVQSPPSH